jgi:hypothetical protein
LNKPTSVLVDSALINMASQNSIIDVFFRVHFFNQSLQELTPYDARIISFLILIHPFFVLRIRVIL